MASSPSYSFDQWAEYLTVTIAENISRCQLASNKVKKVRLTLNPKQNWPIHFKVIMDNDRVAQYPNQTAHSDASYDIDYMYACPCSIPNGQNIDDVVAKKFIPKAQSLDEAFFADAWSLSSNGCIPYLLRQLSFRSVSKLLAKQLQHQGVEMDNDFEVQFYDGENYQSFSYDSIKQELTRQMQFYMGNAQVKELASKLCFKHKINRDWFNSLQ